ncbi:hypothetical protein SAMN05216167_11922 [Spirosoma endophyticum]|uniref:Uncharacterized protein n=1 Tax=Spirosoma endophyticum TaxID=662367 RepID=A0A1I2D674_9BACT|nr:hypothetical protein SAMN05216167_11922 [Spirosoma endophyticum]
MQLIFNYCKHYNDAGFQTVVGCAFQATQVKRLLDQVMINRTGELRSFIFLQSQLSGLSSKYICNKRACFKLVE